MKPGNKLETFQILVKGSYNWATRTLGMHDMVNSEKYCWKLVMSELMMQSGFKGMLSAVL